MDNSDRSDAVRSGLRVAAFVYYTVMLAAFIVGLYGLFSLFFLASAEVQHSVQILP